MAYVYVNDHGSKEKFSSLTITREPQRILLCIEENEIISLEKAVDPLVEFIPKLSEKVRLAKQKCINPSDGLSCDESASIYLISMRWKPDDKCFYSILNATLRNYDQETLKPWNLYLQLLLTALNRLPSRRITFYEDIKYNYLKDNFFIFRDFTFCSSSIPLSQSNITEKRTIFAFECCNAKFIEQHSSDQCKNEYLLIPTQFQFHRYLDRKNDLDIIQLKDIHQSFPLIQLTVHSNQPSPITSIREVSRKTTIIPSINSFVRNPKLEYHISLHQPRSEMSLAYQKLTVDDMPIIIEEAIVGKQCSKLWLNENNITIECLSILVSALHNNTTLKELYLNDTGISDESIQILTQTLAIDSCAINKLGLYKNYITDNSIPYLIEMLTKNTTLTCLYLFPNSITKKGKNRLVKALAINTRLSIV